MQSRNLAARAGRWSSTHRKTAIFGWLALVVLSLAIGGAVGTNNLKDEDQGTGQSRSAQQVVNDNFPKKGDENILIQTRSGSLNPSSPQIKSAVRRRHRRGVRLPDGVRGQVAARPAQPGADLQGRALGPGDLLGRG